MAEMADENTSKMTQMLTRTYPEDPTDSDNKVWKVFKQGKWVRIPFLRKFNPNYYIRLHPGQILPIWYYKFQDRTELFVVEINEGILYFHSDRPEDVLQKMPLVEVQILNKQTVHYLIEQALLRHARFRSLVHVTEGRSADHAHRMADECHIMFVRLVYERAVKMGLNIEDFEQRDIETHRKWLSGLEIKVARTAFTNYHLNFEATSDNRMVKDDSNRLGLQELSERLMKIKDDEGEGAQALKNLRSLKIN